MTEAYKAPFYASLEIDRMINEGGHVDPARDTKLGHTFLEIDRMINEGGHIDPARDTESFVSRKRQRTI